MEDFKEKVTKFIKNISKKFKHKKSNKYYIFIFICVIGYGFFLTSGKVFNDKSNIRSTEIYYKTDIQNMSVQLMKRKYNSQNNLIQLIIKTEYKTDRIDTNLKIEAVEKNDLSNLLETKSIRLNQDYIIVTIRAPKKWTTVSVSIKEHQENSANEEVYASSNEGVKFYVDSRDIDINSNLHEKDRVGYLVEVVNEEIKMEEENILKIDKNIQEQGVKIKNLKTQIENMEEDKKYQTEDEKSNTNSNISTKQNSILTAQNEMAKLKDQKKKTGEKIKMLERKAEDIKKNE